MSSLLPRVLSLTPSFVHKRMLAQLFGATAAAFQREMPDLRGLSSEQSLLAYARFTSEWAGDALRCGDDPLELQARLYANAYRLGRLPGRFLRSRSVDDVMMLAQFLYGVLEIDFDGNSSGEITIRRCYFSEFYSPPKCRLLSFMDHGLLAGLAGGGELTFTQRITAGQACCRARFSMEGGGTSSTAAREFDPK